MCLTEQKVNEKEMMANLVKINVAKKTLEVRLKSSEFGKRKKKDKSTKRKESWTIKNDADDDR